MGEGNVFTGVCPFTGGTPVPGSFPGPFGEGTPVLAQEGSTPYLAGEGGGTPVLVGCTPVLTRGVSRPWLGCPSVVYHHLGEHGVPLGQIRMEYTSARTGVPPGQVRMGSPLGQDWDTPLTSTGYALPQGQNSTVSTCYTVGRMPLAVTQEDFLVFALYSSFS